MSGYDALVPEGVTGRDVQDIFPLSKNDPDFEYALFRVVAALNRVADRFPTPHYHATESAIGNPEVQKMSRTSTVQNIACQDLFKIAGLLKNILQPQDRQ